jgi:phage gp16-like protein
MAEAARKDPYRAREIAALHAMAKELALTEDSRRDIMERVTGKRSAGDLTPRERQAVLDEFRRLGAGKAKARRRLRVQPAPEMAGMVAKARAMWISLHQLGAIADPTDASLEAWAKRQTKAHTADGAGLAALAWAGPAEMRSIIEGLWAIAGRHGWTKPIAPEIESFNRMRDAHGLPPRGSATLAKIKLVLALWDQLVKAGVFRAGTFARLETWLQSRSIAVVVHPYQLDDDQAERAAVKLAKWLAEVRAEKAEGGAA